MPGSKPTRHRNKWRARWRDETGARHSEVYERYDDALLALQRHEVEVAELKRNLRPALRASNKTFGELCDYWIEKRAPLKRSGGDDKSVIRAHLRPLFGRLKLAELSASHVDVFRQQRTHLSVKTVANILTLLITMLNAAKDDLHWVAFVPKIRKPKGADRKYSYLRTKDEIRRFFEAAREEADVTYTMYVTAVYTGMRAGELAGLRWEDVDFETRLITVQHSYDGPTKNTHIRHVPILDALLKPLRDWRLRCPTAWVFPNERGSMHGKSARIFQELFHRTLARAAFPMQSVGNRTRHYIRFHDLRHTFASHWMMNGGDLFKLQKILGHQSAQMTMRYAHLSPDVFVDDYERLSDLTCSKNGAEVRDLRSGTET